MASTALLCALILLAVNAATAAAAVTGQPAPASIDVCFNATTLSVNEELLVQWRSANLVPPSTVELVLLRNSLYVLTIASAAPNTGSFAWTPSSSGLYVAAANRTGYQIRVRSLEQPLVLAASSVFSFLAVPQSYPVARVFPDGNLLLDFDQAQGLPLNRAWKGQRYSSLYYWSDFNVSTASVLIYSLSLKIEPFPRVPFYDIENFRLGYAVVPASLTSFEIDTALPATDTILEIPLISADQLYFMPNQSLRFTFPRPVRLDSPNNIVFEWSSLTYGDNVDLEHSVDDTYFGQPYLAATSNFRSKKMYSDLWGDLSYDYPYPQLPGQFVYTRAYIPVTDFSVEGVAARVATCGAAPTVQQVATDYRWQSLTSSSSPSNTDCGVDVTGHSPGCRTGSSLIAYSNRLVLFAGAVRGTSGTSYQNDVWVFDLSSATWSSVVTTSAASACDVSAGAPDGVAPSRPPCRYRHSAAVVGDAMVVFGGLNSHGILSDLCVLNLTLVLRYANSTTPLSDTVMDSLWARRPNIVVRNTVAIPLIRGSYDHVAVTVGDMMFVFGGLVRGPDNATVVNGAVVAVQRADDIRSDQLFRYSLSAGQWTDLTDGSSDSATGSCQVAARCLSQPAVATYNQSILIVGGTTGIGSAAQSTNGVFSYSPATQLWTTVSAANCSDATLLPCRTAAAAAVLDASVLAVFGGGSVTGNNFAYASANDVWQLDLASDVPQWLSFLDAPCSSPSGSSQPQCRRMHAAAASGDSVIVFGGEYAVNASSALLGDLWGYRRTPVILSGQTLPVVSVGGGANITITGRNFGGGAALLRVYTYREGGPRQTCVSVRNVTNGQDLPSETNGTQQIVCTVAAGLGGPIFGIVAVVDGVVWESSPVQLFSYALPVITGVTFVQPFTASSGGGDGITVTGSEFGRDKFLLPVVYIGSTACEQPRRASSGSLFCIAPPGVGANLPITVHSGSQVSAPATTLFSIQMLSSGIVATSGGAVFAVYGHDFGPSAAVSNPVIFVGATPCTSTVLNTSSVPSSDGIPVSQEIATCVVPPGAGANLSVTIRIGDQTSLPAGQNFSYDPPIVTSLVYDPAPTVGGSMLTIFGYNIWDPFSQSAPPSLVVAIGGAPCSTTSFLGAARRANATFPITRSDGLVLSELQCTVPQGAGANQSVSVSVGGQEATAAGFGFSYVAPRVDTVSPYPVQADSHVVLTLYGDDFGSDADKVIVASSLVSCGQVVVLTPHRAISCLLVTPSSEAVLDMVVTVGGQASSAFPVKVTLEPVSSVAVTVCVTIAAVAEGMCVVLLIGLTYYKKHRTIRATSLVFSIIVVLGAMIFLSAVFLLDQQREPQCLVPAYIVSVGFSLLYGVLVLKNYRILRLFQNKTLKSSLISDNTLLSLVVVLVVLDVLLLLPWHLTDSGGNCDLPSGTFAQVCLALLLFDKLVIIVAGMVIAWQSRIVHLPQFNDRVSLGYAAYNLAFFTVVSVIVIVFFRSQVQQQYALRALFIILVTLLTLAILYVPKFHEIWFVSPLEDSAPPSSARTVMSRDPSESTLKRQQSTSSNAGSSGRMPRKSSLRMQSRSQTMASRGSSDGMGDAYAVPLQRTSSSPPPLPAASSSDSMGVAHLPRNGSTDGVPYPYRSPSEPIGSGAATGDRVVRMSPDVDGVPLSPVTPPAADGSAYSSAYRS